MESIVLNTLDKVSTDALKNRSAAEDSVVRELLDSELLCVGGGAGEVILG